MGRAAARRGTATKPAADRSPGAPGFGSRPVQLPAPGPACWAPQLCAWGRREERCGRTETRCRPGLSPPTPTSRRCCSGALGLPTPRPCPAAPKLRRGPTGPAALARPARQPPTAAARVPGAARTHRGQLPNTWWRCRGPRPRAGRALHGPRRREPRGAAGRSIRPGAAASQNRFTRRGRGGGRRRREGRGR